MKSYNLGERRRRWKIVVLSIMAFILILLGFVAFGIRRVYNENLLPISASQKTILITIPSGATVQEIGKKLEDEGIIKASWAFEWYVRNNNLRDRLQAGTYSLRPSQGIAEIVDSLTQGKVATDLITILPGQRLDQIRNSLINNGGFSAEEVDEALNASNYSKHPALADKPAAANLEGYLYPDSYQITTDTKVKSIITSALDEMQKKLTPEIRAAFVRQGLNTHEGVIMASIVTQEVSNDSDKPKVAQVFLLRYKIGMELGSDVTAFYGALKASQEPTVFYDSPYNTRIYQGLPPGAISNVNASSLAAVANPATTDYVFFVAGDDGKTYFSHTLKEHEELTAKHCKKLCG